MSVCYAADTFIQALSASFWSMLEERGTRVVSLQAMRRPQVCGRNNASEADSFAKAKLCAQVPLSPRKRKIRQGAHAQDFCTDVLNHTALAYLRHFPHYMYMNSFVRFFARRAVCAAAAVCAGTAAVSADDSIPLLKEIQASAVSATEITVTWELPSPLPSGNNAIQEIWLYRDTKPISQRSSLASLEPVAKLPPGDTAYTDTVAEYTEYYYALTVLTADSFQYDIILPAINATAAGVRPGHHITETQTARDTDELPVIDGIRGTPLPFLDLLPNQTRTPAPFDDGTLAAAAALARTETPDTGRRMEPHVFAEEQAADSTGDDYLLRQIIEETFARGDYAGANERLTEFLTLNRTAQTTARAYFYIAQSLYFIQDYRHALTYFLQIEDTFPDIAPQWIHSALALYQLPDSGTGA